MLLSETRRVKRRTASFNRWVKGQLAMNDLNQKDLAEHLDMSPQALSYRLRNNIPFDYSQILVIFEVLRTDEQTISTLFKGE